MEIKTKYNVDDSLWFIEDNKVLNLPVKEINIEYKPFFNNELRIMYIFFEREEYEMFPQWNKTLCYIKKENEVYKTKQELLNNL